MGISQELQEVMAAIERLNPEWQAELGSSYGHDKITFSKDTEEGTYRGEIRTDTYSAVNIECAYIFVRFFSRNGALDTVIFRKRCGTPSVPRDRFCRKWHEPPARGEDGEFQYLKHYIENNQAYRETVSRQELEYTRAREAEQDKEEAAERATARFLGRKTRRR